MVVTVGRKKRSWRWLIVTAVSRVDDHAIVEMAPEYRFEDCGDLCGGVPATDDDHPLVGREVVRLVADGEDVPVYSDRLTDHALGVGRLDTGLDTVERRLVGRPLGER
jgi:hypothetical protein